MSRSTKRHVWVDSDTGLEKACADIADAGLFGLDIEFMRVNTYFPDAALYQLATADEVFLVDVLAVTEFDPLKRLLASNSITKVVHAGGEDMEVMRTHLGLQPRNLFDTQLAAAVAGYGWSLGYAPLVKETLAIDLAKDARRSDWLARPLSPKQINYAVQDVVYLLQLHALLVSRLRECGRHGWFTEEISRWFERDGTSPDTYYLKIGGARGMQPRQLAVLRALCAWREREAMRRNRPRQWLVRDSHLLRFARAERLDLERVSRELPRDVAKRFGDGLLEAFETGRCAESVPAPLDKNLSAADRAVVKEILAQLDAVAKDLKVPLELLGRRRELEKCVNEWRAGHPPSEYVAGWRRPYLEPLLVRWLGDRPPITKTGAD